MGQIERVSVLLPSYNPGGKILQVIRDVIAQGFCDIIVVNDGSGKSSAPYFAEIAKMDGCSVLHHEENKGKGAALKTGIAYFLANRPAGAGIVAIDDDGQHLPADIRFCAEAMLENDALVLGVRDFSAKNVPLKSSFGNKFTIMVFKLLIGLNISDTQTGLRAIPKLYLASMQNVSGNRFEYETNMLIAAKKEKMTILEVPIGTVYHDKNKATHYRGLADSLVIIIQLAKYACGALLSWAIDFLGFFLLLKFLSANLAFRQWTLIFISTLVARLVSAVFNFIFNKNIVFEYKGKDTGKALVKYAALCGCVVLVSSQLVALLASLPFISANPFSITVVKFFVDAVLFIMNYYIQRRWVYK